MRLLILLILLLAGLGLTTIQAAEIKLTFATASSASLGNPHDLKLSPDGRYLFVADVDNDRVAILDPDSLQLVAAFGADHQDGTHDIDFDKKGRAYVADTHNNRVTIYEIDGKAARLTGELKQRIRGPEGVLVHPNGRVYVAGAWSGNVVAYQDGRVVGEITGLFSPHDLELSKSGDIWLAEAGSDRLLLLSPDLDILEELGRDQYDFDGVRYLDLTPDGTIVAADKNNHVVKFIAADGKLLFVLGDGKPGKDEYRLRTPEGVEIKASTLWISDSGNDRVLKYRLQVK